MKGYLIIDGNSVGHFHNNTKPLTIGNLQVQAIYGFLRSLRSMVALYPHLQPVVLWDGASWRKVLFPDYKAIRDKADTENERKLLAMKETYKTQAPYIQKALRFLGVPQVKAFNYEADDLGAMLVDRYTALGMSCVMWTGDKDWIQLVGPKVTWRDVRENGKRRITLSNFEEETGCKSVQQFVEMKALTGDAGDSVPGVGGIGDKGALQFLADYGSFSDFMNMWTLEKSVSDAEFKKLPKKFRDLILDESKALKFQRNIELVDLRTPARPAPINLRVDKGDPDVAKFQAFCDLLLFKSITQELDDWLRVFPSFKTNLAEAA